MLAEVHGGIRALARAMAGQGDTDLEPTVRRWLALATAAARPTLLCIGIPARVMMMFVRMPPPTPGDALQAGRLTGRKQL